MNLHVSPSLQRSDAWAYEFKFDVSHEIAEAIYNWSLDNMTPDTHGSDGGRYEVHTLCLDTPEEDVLNRSPGYKSKRLRIRRYGAAELAFVEEKRKRGRKVQKSRAQLELAMGDAIPILDLESIPDGAWFPKAVVSRRLRPTCLLSYNRAAFNAMTPAGPVRLTIDDNVHALQHGDWSLREAWQGVRVQPERCILELKFSVTMPKIFRQLVEDRGLVHRGISKYRLGHFALKELAAPEVARCQSF